MPRPRSVQLLCLFFSCPHHAGDDSCSQLTCTADPVNIEKWREQFEQDLIESGGLNGEVYRPDE